jgi:glycosyltransferase involved in cell wall biosynthesis
MRASEKILLPVAPPDPETVNSRAYWDRRFIEDWEARGGPNQSRFFATLLLNWLSPRVRAEIASGRLSICDWGCAEGDGTAVIAAAFPDSTVTGIDLSQAAISRATTRYPAIDFRVGDVDAVADGYDVIVTSNVLEHLDDPWRAAAMLARAARRYVLVLVPFLDSTQEPEHRYVFGPLDLRERLDDEMVLAEACGIDTRQIPLSCWPGMQLLAIYRRLGEGDEAVAAGEIAAIQKLQLAIEYDAGIPGSGFPPGWRTATGLRLAEAYVRLREAHAKLEEYAEALGRAAAAREAELVEVTAARENALSRATQLTKLLSTQEQRNATLEQHNATLKQQTAEVVQHHAALRQRNVDLELAATNAAALTRWSEEAEQLYERLASMLTATLASTSWRVTSPLRSTVRLLRRTGPETSPMLPALPRPPFRSESAPGEAAVPAMAIAPAAAPLSRLPAVGQATRAEPAPVLGMLIRDFDSGGLEQFVLNLSKGLGRHGMPAAILVTGRAGHLAQEAARVGIPVFASGHDPEALERVVRRFDLRVMLAHHCFVGWDRLSASGVQIIEVLQNLYHWHREDIDHRQLRQMADRFVAVSKDVHDYAVRFLRIDPARLMNIPNGIDTSGFFRPRASVLLEQRRRGEFVFLHVAQIWPAKCHHSVLTAFARLHAERPQSRLTFAGAAADADVHGRLVQRIEAMGLADSVTLTGALDQRELSRLYARANALLLPSLIEGFSLASLEGLYFGLPLIMTDVGGAREIIEGEDIGLLIAAPCPADVLTPERSRALGASDDAGHADALHAAMRRMVLERDVWLTKGLDGMAKFPSFDIDTVTARYEALLAPAFVARG